MATKTKVESTTTKPKAAPKSAGPKTRKVVVNTNRREEFEVPVEQQTAAPAPPIEEEEEIPFDPNDPYHVIDSLLTNVEASEIYNYKLKIWRLPNYKLNGNYIKNTNAEFCETIPPTLDYIEYTQAKHGPGDYRFDLVKPNGQFEARWPESIAPPQLIGSQPGQQPGRQVNYFMSQQPGAQQTTAAAPTLIEQLKQIAEIKELLVKAGFIPEQQQPQTVVQTTEGSLEQRTEDKILGFLIDQALTSGNKSDAIKIIDRVLPARDDDFTWKDVFKEIGVPLFQSAKEYLPQILGLIFRNSNQGQATPPGAYQPGVFQPQQPAINQATPPGELAQAPPGSQPVPVQQPVQQQDYFQRLMRRIILDFLDGMKLDYPANAFEDFLVAFPDEAPKVQGFIDAPPGELAKALAPSGVDLMAFGNFIEALQTELKARAEETNNDENQEIEDNNEPEQ